MNLLKPLGMAISLLFSLPISANNDFDRALTRHAQSSAHAITSQWIERRATSMSWDQVLREFVPTQLDSRCGFIDRVGLRSVSFDRARALTTPVVGSRLADRFAPMLDRPRAQLTLLGASTHGQEPDYAMVNLRVTPARTGDPALSLLLRLDGNGEMALCDIAENGNEKAGILRIIGNELKYTN